MNLGQVFSKIDRNRELRRKMFDTLSFQGARIKTGVYEIGLIECQSDFNYQPIWPSTRLTDLLFFIFMKCCRTPLLFFRILPQTVTSYVLKKVL